MARELDGSVCIFEGFLTTLGEADLDAFALFEAKLLGCASEVTY